MFVSFREGITSKSNIAFPYISMNDLGFPLPLTVANEGYIISGFVQEN